MGPTFVVTEECFMGIRVLVWCQRDLKRVHKQFPSVPFRHRFRSDPDNYSINASIIELLGAIEYRLSRDVSSETGEVVRE